MTVLGYYLFINRKTAAILLEFVETGVQTEENAATISFFLSGLKELTRSGLMDVFDKEAT